MIGISCQDALGEGGVAAAAVRSPQSGAGEEVPHRNWGVDLETKVHPKVLNHGEGPYYGFLLVKNGY